MSRLLFLIAVVGCVLVAVDGSVTCTTRGNSGKNKAKIGYIELTFSQPYELGNYTLFEAIASISVIHDGAYNRPFPVVNIEYPNSNTILLFLLESSDAEGTTGYTFHVHYTPLVNRSGHLAFVSGLPLVAFSCSTTDESPPSVVFQAVIFDDSTTLMFFYFSEPVTREFNHSVLCYGNGNPDEESVTAYPYEPDPDGYSRIYKTSSFNLDYGALCICAANVVEDVEENLSVVPGCFSIAQVYSSGVLTDDNYNRAISSEDYSIDISGSTAQYDLDNDGLVDTVFVHSLFLWNESVLQSSISGINVDRSNRLPTQEDSLGESSETNLNRTLLPDDDAIDNTFVLRVDAPSNLYDTHESLRVYYESMSKPIFVPWSHTMTYFTSSALASVPSGSTAPIVRNAFVVSPKITEFVAYNRSYICARVSRKHISSLDQAYFYYASTSAEGNRLNSTFNNTNDTSRACFNLKTPMQRSSVHTQSSSPDLLFLQPKVYGNIEPSVSGQYVGYTRNSRIPKWQGTPATLLEYQPPVLLYAQLESKDNQTTWQTLRLVFNEPVYLVSGSFIINLLSLSQPVDSFSVPFPSLAASRLPREIELTINTTCISSPPAVDNEINRTIEIATCYGTGSSVIQVTRIQGIEDELFNLIVPIVGGLTLIDKVRPHLVTVTVHKQWTVIFTFSEPVQYTQVQFNSTYSGYTLLNTTHDGAHVTLSFAPSEILYDITIERCGIFSEDMAGNLLVCIDLPVFIQLGSITIDDSSSSSSLSTGAIVGIGVGSAAAIGGVVALAIYATKATLVSSLPVVSTKYGHKRRTGKKHSKRIIPEEHQDLVNEDINLSD